MKDGRGCVPAAVAVLLLEFLQEHPLGMLPLGRTKLVVGTQKLTCAKSRLDRALGVAIGPGSIAEARPGQGCFEESDLAIAELRAATPTASRRLC